MLVSSSYNVCAADRVTKYVVEDMKAIKLEPSVEVSASCLFTCFFCDAQFNEKIVLKRHQDNCRFRHSTLRTAFVRKLEQHPKKVDLFRNLGLVSAAPSDSDVTCGRRNDLYTAVIVVDDSDDEENCPPHESELKSPLKWVAKRRENGWSLTRLRRRDVTPVQKSLRSDKLGLKSSRSLSRLLSVDLCSPLGELAKRHIDASASSVRTVEGCVINSSTDAAAEYHPFYDDDPASRARGDRSRHSSHPRRFPVTFHRCRGYRTQFCHKYKYSRQQRRQFCENFDSGLNVLSRNLLKRMKPCEVNLTRLPVALLSDGGVSNLSGCPDGKTTHDCAVPVGAVSPISVTPNYQVEPVVRSTPSTSPLPTELRTSLSDRLTAETIMEPGEHLRSSFSAAINVQSDVSVGRNPKKRNCFVLLDDYCRSKGKAKRSTQALGGELPDVDIVTAAGTDANGNLQDSSACGNGTDAESSDEERVQKSRRSSATDKANTHSSGFVYQAAANLSANDDLPPLSFLCHICNIVIECDRDSKALISKHYTVHGVNNVDLVRITLPSGEILLKLVEVTVQKPVTSTVPLRDNSTATPAPTSTRGILVKIPRAGIPSLPLERSRPSRKRKRVTWADETRERDSILTDQIARLELVKEFDELSGDICAVPHDRREQMRETTSLATRLSFYNKLACISPAFMGGSGRPKHAVIQNCPRNPVAHPPNVGDSETVPDSNRLSGGAQPPVSSSAVSDVSTGCPNVIQSTTFSTGSDVSRLPYDVIRDSPRDSCIRDNRVRRIRSLAPNDICDSSSAHQQRAKNWTATNNTHDFVPMTVLPHQPLQFPDYDVICVD